MNECNNNQMFNPEQNTPADNHADEPLTQSAAQNSDTEQKPAAGENLYARTDANQNAAFAQSESFHRETPYGNTGNPASADSASGAAPQTNGTAQNAYTAPGAQGQPAANFNPYTGQPYNQPNAAYSNPSRKEKKQKKERKGGGFFRKAAAAVALALIFGLVSGAVIRGMTGGLPSASPLPSDSQETNDNVSGLNTASSGDLKSASALMEEALKKAELAAADNLTVPQINIIMEPAMVSINCIGTTTVNSFFGQQTYQTASSGSGIIVGANETELLIVTNNHVIDDADEISVVYVNDDSSSALVKGTDATNDLAIIVVKLDEISEETMKAIAYAELGDSDALVVGESVVAIGNALGYGQSVTTGCVSALNRAVTDSNNNTTYLIQTDAAINPGNSGGALVNMKGQVIGINSAKYSDEAVEGMGFAIPINTALPILEELMTRVTRVVVDDPAKAAYLGITPQDISSTMAAAYNMPVGVYVTAVAADSAADRAGMMAGDIITKFDHETVTGISALQKLLSYYESGETVEIVVQRVEHGQYVEVTLNVTLDTKPETTSSGDTDSDNDEEASPSWKDYFGR